MDRVPSSGFEIKPGTDTSIEFGKEFTSKQSRPKLKCINSDHLESKSDFHKHIIDSGYVYSQK